jgi:hypothetical protein
MQEKAVEEESEANPAKPEEAEQSGERTFSDPFPSSTDRLFPLVLETQQIAAMLGHQLEHASGVFLCFAT